MPLCDGIINASGDVVGNRRPLFQLPLRQRPRAWRAPLSPRIKRETTVDTARVPVGDNGGDGVDMHRLATVREQRHCSIAYRRNLGKQVAFKDLVHGALGNPLAHDFLWDAQRGGQFRQGRDAEVIGELLDCGGEFVLEPVGDEPFAIDAPLCLGHGSARGPGEADQVQQRCGHSVGNGEQAWHIVAELANQSQRRVAVKEPGAEDFAIGAGIGECRQQCALQLSNAFARNTKLLTKLRQGGAVEEAAVEDYWKAFILVGNVLNFAFSTGEDVGDSVVEAGHLFAHGFRNVGFVLCLVEDALGGPGDCQPIQQHRCLGSCRVVPANAEVTGVVEGVVRGVICGVIGSVVHGDIACFKLIERMRDRICHQFLDAHTAITFEVLQVSDCELADETIAQRGVFDLRFSQPQFG